MDEQQYEIVVGGEVLIGTKRETKIKAFEEKFIVPEKDGEALALIQNRLLTPRLQGKVEGFKRWRTCKLIAQKLLDSKAKPKQLAETDIPKMTLSEMSDFAVAKKLKIDVNKFGSVEDARRELQKEMDDQKLAAKVKAERAAAKSSKSKAKAKAGAEEFGDDI